MHVRSWLTATALAAAALPLQAQQQAEPLRSHLTVQGGLVLDGGFGRAGLQAGVYAPGGNGSLVAGVARYGPFGAASVQPMTVVEGSFALRESMVLDAGYELGIGRGHLAPYVGFGAGVLFTGADRLVTGDLRAGLAGSADRGLRVEARLVAGEDFFAPVVSLGYRVPLSGR
jgi:hypothetical protein